MGSKPFSFQILSHHSALSTPMLTHIALGRGRPASLLTHFNKFPLIKNRWVCRTRSVGVSIEEMLSIGMAQDEKQAPLDLNLGLHAFVDKVRMCNRGREKKSDFLPFIVENDIIGYIHPTISEHLKQFQDVFILENNFDHSNDIFTNEACTSGYVTLHHQLETSDERTEAIGGAIKWLHKEGVILGLRNELYPVALAFGTKLLFSLERAAVPYFGTKAYGVHMNGYVDFGGEKSLWIGKRSETKATFPGMLDHLVAGGLPVGITCKENLIKECNEEAGIPRNIAEMAIPVGAVSYEEIDGNRCKRDVLFCYDLLLPDDFQPNSTDGEVESFMLVPVAEVANVIRKTKRFKPNCAIVIIDFLFRHGYINPNQPGYLQLLQSLRSGECL